MSITSNSSRACDETWPKQACIQFRQSISRWVTKATSLIREIIDDDQDIYNNERITKSHAYLVTRHNDGAFNLFNVIDKQQHRIRRKLIGEAVSARSMRQFEPTMVAQIDIYLRKIFESSRSSGLEAGAVNVTDRMKRLSFDIVSRLAFGYPLDSQNNQGYGLVSKAITSGSYLHVSYHVPSIRVGSTPTR